MPPKNVGRGYLRLKKILESIGFVDFGGFANGPKWAIRPFPRKLQIELNAKLLGKLYGFFVGAYVVTKMSSNSALAILMMEHITTAKGLRAEGEWKANAWHWSIGFAQIIIKHSNNNWNEPASSPHWLTLLAQSILMGHSRISICVLCSNVFLHLNYNI